MERIAGRSEQIREHTYRWKSEISSHFRAWPNEWNRLCAAMDVLDDTCLALEDYEAHGFGSEDGEKYLRVYGMLQSIYLQQESISHLYRIFTDEALNVAPSSAWSQIRSVRNLAVGHPVEASWGRMHCFISRATINDDGFTIIIWDKEEQKDEIREIALRSLYESYKSEALKHLGTTYEAEVAKWPEAG